jgi:spore germination protein
MLKRNFPLFWVTNIFLLLFAFSIKADDQIVLIKKEQTTKKVEEKTNTDKSSLDKCSFKEVWGFVMNREERFVSKEKPITDLVYFCAKIDEIGKIQNIPNINKLRIRVNENVKIHLCVFAPYSKTLMYFCLRKDPEIRAELINDIVNLASKFDGINIDLESIRKEEKEYFESFLQEIKDKMPEGKILSVALPARVRKFSDAYDYEKISKIVDRAIIMAYDEHYSGGPPGAICSLNWCKRVTKYAKSTIPTNKLVIGLPLYGRVWQKQKIAKALKYFQTLDLWKKYSSIVHRETDKTPYFTFKEVVDGIVYFEDPKSLKSKLDLYESENIKSISLWRISQEPAALWDSISIN